MGKFAHWVAGTFKTLYLLCMNRNQIALLSGAGAYTLWGLLPLFWHQLVDVSAATVVAHRVVWSALTLLSVFALVPRLVKSVVVERRQAARYSASALVLSAN